MPPTLRSWQGHGGIILLKGVELESIIKSTINSSLFYQLFIDEYLICFYLCFLIYFKLTPTPNCHSTQITGIHSPSLSFTLAWQQDPLQVKYERSPSDSLYLSLLVSMEAESRTYDPFRTCDTTIFTSRNSVARLGCCASNLVSNNSHSFHKCLDITQML